MRIVETPSDNSKNIWPLLTNPQPDEVLFLYLTVFATIISYVLVREIGTVQKPIYYTSRPIKDAETRYSRIEKIMLSLLILARRLHPYFQSHTVAVLTDLPL